MYTLSIKSSSDSNKSPKTSSNLLFHLLVPTVGESQEAIVRSSGRNADLNAWWTLIGWNSGLLIVQQTPRFAAAPLFLPYTLTHTTPTPHKHSLSEVLGVLTQVFSSSVLVLAC